MVRGPLRAPSPASVWNAAPTVTISHCHSIPHAVLGDERLTGITSRIVDVLESEWILIHGH
jgi:hypothetical protein